MPTSIQADQMVGIVSNTLNYVDPRLIDHGSHVGWTVYKALQSLGKHSPKQLCDMGFLSLLHDIGAYKTEEIDKMMRFETTDVWNHSIYGYLFLKNFSPLSPLAPAVLFHHQPLNVLDRCDPVHHTLAQLIHVADRIDTLRQRHVPLNDEVYKKHILPRRGIQFREDVVDLIMDNHLFADEIAWQNLRHAFRDVVYTAEEIEAYLTMVVFSIEFRSKQTMNHTLAVACTAVALAELYGLPRDQVAKIKIAALVHDLGKQAIPLRILESPERLGPEDMKIMKTHVAHTAKILAGNIDPEIMNIAVRHHEKLDGSGYFEGIMEEDLTMPQRLMAVADIMSALFGVRSYKGAFSKDKIIAIMQEMVDNRKIDEELSQLAFDNFDAIMEEVEKVSRQVAAAYDKLNSDNSRLNEMIRNSEAEHLTGL